MAELDRTRRVVAWAEWAAVGLLLAIMLGALAARYQALMGQPLNKDLPGFLAGARQMRLFYDSGVREPLHVLAIKIGLWLVSGDERALRLVSVTETLLSALSIWWAGRRLIGRVGALLVLWLYTINPVVLYYGASGMRVPLYTACIALFTGLLFGPWPRSRRLLFAILVGLAGALVVLTRTPGALLVAGSLLLFGLEHWRTPAWSGALRAAGIAAAVTVVLALPARLLRDDHILGDNLRYLYALERTGSSSTWTTAPPISGFDYFFVVHTPLETLTRTLANHWRFVSDYLPFMLRGYGAVALLFPVGVLLALGTRRWGLAASWVLALAPIVFWLNLDQLGPGSGMEMRLVLHLLPLALWLCAAPLLWTLSLGLRSLATRRGMSSLAAAARLLWPARRSPISEAGSSLIDLAPPRDAQPQRDHA